MKTSMFRIHPWGFASAAILFGASLLWLGGESRAELVVAPDVREESLEAVQDKQPDFELDTKIFLHRNGIVAAAPACASRV